MKRLALCFLATTLAVPAAASAQYYPEPPPPAAVAADVAVAGPDAYARYRDYRRLDRGGMVPNYWWGPAYMVGDWEGYGLYQPQPGYRWIRYYDDALLIDSYGRVLDGRYGMDWSSYSGWGYDANGIPVFANIRTEGYGLEHHGGGYSYDQSGAAYPGQVYPGYGQSYSGYGQDGYGYQAGGWVTETTVTRDCGGAVVGAPPPLLPPPPLPGERG